MAVVEVAGVAVAARRLRALPQVELPRHQEDMLVDGGLRLRLDRRDERLDRRVDRRDLWRDEEVGGERGGEGGGSDP